MSAPIMSTGQRLRNAANDAAKAAAERKLLIWLPFGMSAAVNSESVARLGDMTEARARRTLRRLITKGKVRRVWDRSANGRREYVYYQLTFDEMRASP